MGVWFPTESTVRGIRGDLDERLKAYPEIWPKYCQKVPSTTQVEPYVWSGAVPKPREMADGRRIQGLRQLTYNVTNNEYELTVLIDRKTFEDDQIGTVKQKIAELSDAWGPFKDEIVADMLEAGGTNLAYDGTSFFDDTRTQGKSGTIDNNSTSVAAADSAVPTNAEFLDAMNAILVLMHGYKDDQGREGYNRTAMMTLRVMAEQAMMRPVLEGLSSTLISNTDNVFGRGLAEPDFSPFLTAGSTTRTMYVAAMGASARGPLLYQERTPLEVVTFSDPTDLVRYNGLMIALRQRFVFAYGEFRRMLKHVFTT